MRYRLLLLCFGLAPALAARAQSEPATPTEVTPYRYCKVFVDEHVARPLDQLRIVYEKVTRGTPGPRDTGLHSASALSSGGTRLPSATWLGTPAVSIRGATSPS